MAQSLYNTPIVWINSYLQEKLQQDLGFDSIPFFPTSPSTIDNLTELFPEGGMMAVYDRMFRMRHKAFPHTKSEQLLYYFYKMAGDPEALIETTQVIYDLLDREDESAEEVNAWIQSKVVDGLVNINGKSFKPVSFHKFKVYQLQETRDIVNFGTARTYAGNKIIVDYDYHQL